MVDDDELTGLVNADGGSVTASAGIPVTDTSEDDGIVLVSSLAKTAGSFSMTAEVGSAVISGLDWSTGTEFDLTLPSIPPYDAW
jgi:hypothetical protein